MKYSKHFMNQKIEKKVYDVFINSIRNTKSSNDVINFLNDLLSPTERAMLAKRVSIAFMLLEEKYSYEDIIKTLKVSDGTVSKVNSILVLQGSGFRKTIGNLLVRKQIRNSLSEFLDLITPSRITLTGEIYKKPRVLSKLNREKPL